MICKKLEVSVVLTNKKPFDESKGVFFTLKETAIRPLLSLRRPSGSYDEQLRCDAIRSCQP